MFSWNTPSKKKHAIDEKSLHKKHAIDEKSLHKKHAIDEKSLHKKHAIDEKSLHKNEHCIQSPWIDNCPRVTIIKTK